MMTLPSPQVLLLIFGIGVAVFVGMRLNTWLYWRRRSKKRRAGFVAEAEAEELLRRAGYRIVDRQATAVVPMVVDGEEVECEIRFDYVVNFQGQEYLAEVKSGGRAPDPTSPTTRRQLLEYCIAFNTDRILLVDMEARSISTVVFPWLKPRRWWWPFG